MNTLESDELILMLFFLLQLPEPEVVLVLKEYYHACVINEE